MDNVPGTTENLELIFISIYAWYLDPLPGTEWLRCLEQLKPGIDIY